MTFDVRTIAELSSLKIDDERLGDFENDMNSLAEMVGGLPESDDEPLIPDNFMKLRPDVNDCCVISRDELLAGAPETCGGCVCVPNAVPIQERNGDSR